MKIQCVICGKWFDEKEGLLFDQMCCDNCLQQDDEELIKRFKEARILKQVEK